MAAPHKYKSIMYSLGSTDTQCPSQIKDKEVLTMEVTAKGEE